MSGVPCWFWYQCAWDQARLLKPGLRPGTVIIEHQGATRLARTDEISVAARAPAAPPRKR